MLDTVLQWLQWAFPYGLVGAVAWLFSGKIRDARAAKEVHDTYKAMYQDVSRELQEMRTDNEKLYKALTRLERAISRANSCRLWPDCPIRNELQDTKNSRASKNPGRYPHQVQHRIRDSGNSNPDSSRRHGTHDDTDGGDTEPP